MLRTRKSKEDGGQDEQEGEAKKEGGEEEEEKRGLRARQAVTKEDLVVSIVRSASFFCLKQGN